MLPEVTRENKRFAAGCASHLLKGAPGRLFCACSTTPCGGLPTECIGHCVIGRPLRATTGRLSGISCNGSTSRATRCGTPSRRLSSSLSQVGEIDDCFEACSLMGRLLSQEWEGVYWVATRNVRTRRQERVGDKPSNGPPKACRLASLYPKLTPYLHDRLFAMDHHLHRRTLEFLF